MKENKLAKIALVLSVLSSVLLLRTLVSEKPEASNTAVTHKEVTEVLQIRDRVFMVNNYLLGCTRVVSFYYDTEVYDDCSIIKDKKVCEKRTQRRSCDIEIGTGVFVSNGCEVVEVDSFDHYWIVEFAKDTDFYLREGSYILDKDMSPYYKVEKRTLSDRHLGNILKIDCNYPYESIRSY